MVLTSVFFRRPKGRFALVVSLLVPLLLMVQSYIIGREERYLA